MSALYALKYAEPLKITVASSAVVAVGTGLTTLGSVAARGLTNVEGGIANAGWIVGGAIGTLLALPEDLIFSLMFKRQCPQTAGFVKRLGRSEETEKRPLWEVGEKEGQDMV